MVPVLSYDTFRLLADHAAISATGKPTSSACPITEFRKFGNVWGLTIPIAESGTTIYLMTEITPLSVISFSPMLRT